MMNAETRWTIARPDIPPHSMMMNLPTTVSGISSAMPVIARVMNEISSRKCCRRSIGNIRIRALSGRPRDVLQLMLEPLLDAGLHQPPVGDDVEDDVRGEPGEGAEHEQHVDHADDEQQPG